MTIVYTLSGFPTRSQAVGDDTVRYHDATIDAMYASGQPTNNSAFVEELDALVTVIKAWKAAGGLFDNILQDNLRVSASTVSFVLETAMILGGEKTRRGLSFQDWALLLKPNDESVYGPVVLPEIALDLIKGLAGLPTESLIQRWILTAGVHDLLATMKLYVGDIQTKMV